MVSNNQMYVAPRSASVDTSVNAINDGYVAQPPNLDFDPVGSESTASKQAGPAASKIDFLKLGQPSDIFKHPSVNIVIENGAAGKESDQGLKESWLESEETFAWDDFLPASVRYHLEHSWNETVSQASLSFPSSRVSSEEAAKDRADRVTLGGVKNTNQQVLKMEYTYLQQDTKNLNGDCAANASSENPTANPRIFAKNYFSEGVAPYEFGELTTEEKLIAKLFDGHRGSVIKAFCEYDPNVSESQFAIKKSDFFAMAVAHEHMARFKETGERYGYSSVTAASKANEEFKQYRYGKRARGLGEKTIYDNSSRVFVAGVLSLDARALVEIEGLIEDVANSLGVLINGSRVSRSGANDGTSDGGPTGKRQKAQTWNRQPHEVKFRLYAVVKRVLWEHFWFEGRVVEFITKRLAYSIAQNKTKAEKTGRAPAADDGRINKPFKKVVVARKHDA